MLDKLRNGVQGMKSRILARDDYTCQKCGWMDRDRKEEFDVHHIKSISGGGDNHPSNLILLCKECHKYAPDFTPVIYDLPSTEIWNAFVFWLFIDLIIPPQNAKDEKTYYYYVYLNEKHTAWCKYIKDSGKINPNYSKEKLLEKTWILNERHRPEFVEMELVSKKINLQEKEGRDRFIFYVKQEFPRVSTRTVSSFLKGKGVKISHVNVGFILKKRRNDDKRDQ